MTDINELAMIAGESIPLCSVATHLQGPVVAVIQMALRIQAAEYEEQLRRADEEIQDARRKLNESSQTAMQLGDLRVELDAMRQDRNKTHNVLSQEIHDLRSERDAAENESRRWQQTIVELNAEIAALKAKA